MILDVFISDEKSSIYQAFLGQVSLASNLPDQGHQLTHAVGDNSSRQVVLGQQVHKGEHHHVKCRERQLVSIEQEGVEGVSSVGIEDSLFRQVWSLTQFYADDFSKVQGGEKSIFNKRTIKVCISCFVLKPPRLAQDT